MERLIQRLRGYFQRKPVLEISTSRAFHWGNKVSLLREYTNSALKKLREEYPQMIMYSPTRTMFTRESGLAEVGSLFGAIQVYEVYFLANGIDLKELKRTCMQLELKDGQRIGDIDVYSTDGKKISRKDLESEVEK